MAEFKITVPVTFNRVYYIEAESPEQALYYYKTGDGPTPILDVDNEFFDDFCGVDENSALATVEEN